MTYTITKTRFFPELNYWFSNYWKNNQDITLSPIPYIESPKVDYVTFSKNSIFELLFNNDFNRDSFDYLFRDIQLNVLDSQTVTRLKFYNRHHYIWVCSNEGENLLNLEEDDILILEELLKFRKGEEIDIDDFEYIEFPTKLGKMVYQYLELFKYEEYEPFYSENILYDEKSNLTEYLFEIYLVNEAHKLISSWDQKIETDEELFIKPVRKKFVVGEDD